MSTKTPETDNHCGIKNGDDPDNFYCAVPFARQLERDLNEARKEAEKCRDEFYIFTLTWCSSPKKKLPWEKDEP